MAHISVVVPVYRAEDCMHELYRRLKEALETVTPDFEIILVEDCGGDRSWEIIIELANADKRVKGIQLSRNFGQHYAITAGMDYSSGDWVVVMDCDLQDRPEEIPRLYSKAQEGFDVVLARRGKREDPFIRRLASRAFIGIFNYLADTNSDTAVGNFRIMSRKVIHNFCKMREQLRAFVILIDWMGFPATSIDVQDAQRFSGKSTYTFRKLFKLATETIIAYSDKPLRLFIKFGFTMSLLSFLFGGYIILQALLYGTAVLGWSSLMVSLYFIGGVIIANLGIVGIYLGKTFDEVKGRPLYVVSNIVDFAKANQGAQTNGLPVIDVDACAHKKTPDYFHAGR